jgi:hypothetical protein
MGVREWKMRRISRIDKTMLRFTTGLFVTHPLSSECFDVVVMGNVGGVNIRSFRWLGKRCHYVHEMRIVGTVTCLRLFLFLCFPRTIIIRYLLILIIFPPPLLSKDMR